MFLRVAKADGGGGKARTANEKNTGGTKIAVGNLKNSSSSLKKKSITPEVVGKRTRIAKGNL